MYIKVELIEKTEMVENQVGIAKLDARNIQLCPGDVCLVARRGANYALSSMVINMDRREIESIAARVLNNENIKLKRSTQKYTGKGIGG